MSFFGREIVEPVEAIGEAFDKIFTSDEERAAGEAVMEKLKQQPGKLQAAINKVEASHRSIFVAGWRPYIGWVCGAGLTFAFIISPLLEWIFNKPGPDVPLDMMMELVIALLGLGALRTFEKTKGITK